MGEQRKKSYIGSVTGCQFHQHFLAVFFIRKCFVQLLSNYSWAFVIFGDRISAQKLLLAPIQLLLYLTIMLSSIRQIVVKDKKIGPKTVSEKS